MRPLELNVLFYDNDEDDAKLQGLGLETEVNVVEGKMTFYSINGIARYLEDENNDYTSIYSNGTDFICTDKYENVKKLIEQNL